MLELESRKSKLTIGVPKKQFPGKPGGGWWLVPDGVSLVDKARAPAWSLRQGQGISAHLPITNTVRQEGRSFKFAHEVYKSDLILKSHLLTPTELES